VTRLAAELIDKLDLGKALNDELDHFPDLLPKQIVDQALLVNSEGVSDYIRQLALAGEPVEPVAKVVALKWRHGRRTVATLPLYERVLYRAVVQSIATDLVPRERGPAAYAEFQGEPLAHEGAEYVVMTDLANYYASIDIDRLSRELLRRTGQWAQVEWLRHFWTVTSDGFGGIPQMSPTSDIVADTYADLLHRALLRKGLAVWRFADDFRMACPTYGDCVTALEILDELARGLGLTVNERKTLTPSRDKYREIIDGPQRRLELINEAVREELTQVDLYDWSDVSPEQAEVLVEGAKRVIDIWSAEADQTASLDAQAITQVLPQTLLILGASQSERALGAVPDLLRYEPQLTPVVCRYLRLLGPHQKASVASVVGYSISTLTLTKWQRIWLLYVTEGLVLSADRSWDAWLLNWMRREAEDDSVPLRCQAVWSLAQSWNLRRGEWDGLDGMNSRYAAPFSAAALHGVSDLESRVRAQLEPKGRIEELVSQWSKSTHFAPPF
jgi:hypothetical protein